jgi:hypothetical protein
MSRAERKVQRMIAANVSQKAVPLFVLVTGASGASDPGVEGSAGSTILLCSATAMAQQDGGNDQRGGGGGWPLVGEACFNRVESPAGDRMTSTTFGLPGGQQIILNSLRWKDA